MGDSALRRATSSLNVDVWVSLAGTGPAFSMPAVPRAHLGQQRPPWEAEGCGTTGRSHVGLRQGPRKEEQEGALGPAGEGQGAPG